MEFALSYYSLLDLSLNDIIDTIQYGEAKGIQYAFLGQSAVRDCFIGLSQIANATNTIKLGTNVVPIYTRTPTDLAMSVITLNEATGGRFRLLGLGAGGRLKIEPNHGVKVNQIAERTKEYIEIIRGILTGNRLSYQGKFFQLDNAWIPRTYGVGTTASDLAQQEGVPIHIGATGPMVLKVSGAYADGVIFNSLSTPEYLEWAVSVIKEGAEEAGRDYKEVALGCSLVMAANDDPDRVKEAVQRACLYYLREDHHQFTMEKAGMGDLHTRIRETYLKGDVEGALGLIDDDVLEKIAFTGTPDDVRRKVQEYERLGITLAVIRNVVDTKTGKSPVIDNINAVAPLIGQKVS